MYIEQDFVGPATLDLQAQRKIRNRILQHWPTKLNANGVEVMDKLYLYSDGAVQESVNHKKIYGILGVKVEDLKNNEWKGVDKYYLYFNAVQGLQDEVTTEMIDTYIQYQAPFTIEANPAVPPAPPVYDRSEWITSEISYEPLYVDEVSNALSDHTIIEKIKANPYLPEYGLEDEHLLTALALLDTQEVLFERTFRVSARHLTEVVHVSQTAVTNRALFIKEANIEFKFRRKPVVDTLAYTAYLTMLIQAMYDSIHPSASSVRLQLLETYRAIVPFIDSDIMTVDGEYKKAGLEAMKATEFNKTITARIKTGYKKKKVKAWKKVVAVVLVIIIIVLAIFFPPAAGLLGMSGTMTVLVAGTLLMQGLAVVVAKHDPAWGAYIGKCATVLGYVATAVGLYNLTNLIGQQLAGEAATELAKQKLAKAGIEAVEKALLAEVSKLTLLDTIPLITELSLEQLTEQAITMVTNAFANSTSMNMSNVLNWASKGWQVYAKYINPPADGLDEMTRRVQEQKKELEDLTTAGLKDKIDYAFSSPFYNIYDFNEVMQSVPYALTQGKIDNAFSKYYNGVTNKVSYRGYLG